MVKLEEIPTQFHRTIKEKTLALKDETEKRKIRLGKTLKEVKIMDRDPFYMGSKNDLIKAEWAYNLWKEYIDTTRLDNVHIRGLHYFIVMKSQPTPPPSIPNTTFDWNQYENTVPCYVYLVSCVKIARYLGIIPFEGIIDEKNDVTTITWYEPHKTSYKIDAGMRLPVDIPRLDVDLPEVRIIDSDFDKYLKNCAYRYSRDLVYSDFVEKGVEFTKDLVKPFYIEIWSEKTLPSFIHDVFRNLNVNKVVEGGALSITVMYDFVQELNTRGQDGVAFYFSDYDPKGADMAVDMAWKIQWAKCVEVLDNNLRAFVQPIALSEKQIISNDIPLAPIKIKGTQKSKQYDTLKKKFQKQQSVSGYAELQALEARPDLYRDIVKNAIEPWLASPEDINDRINKKFEELIEEIKGQAFEELEKNRDELKKHFDNVVKLTNDIKNALPDYDKIKNQFNEARKLLWDCDADSNMRSKLHSIEDDIDLPEPVPPKIKRNPPVECLYDSWRDFDEQFNILYQKKVTKQRI